MRRGTTVELPFGSGGDARTVANATQTVKFADIEHSRLIFYH